jgi:xylulokinase
LADITGRTIETVAYPLDAGAIGAAIVVAAGMKDMDALDMAKELIKVDHVYVPDQKNREIYQRNYEVFKKLYRSNRNNFKILNNRNK